MKKLLTISFSFFFSFTFFFIHALAPETQAQQYKFKLSNVPPATHPSVLGSVEFAKAVEKETNGRVVIEVHHSGDLGGEKDTFEQIRFGALEMGAISTPIMSVVDRRLEIEQLPYAWPTRQHAYSALDGELGVKLKSLLEAKGIHVLTWFENGYRNMTNNVRPIYKLEDLKGLKIRIPEGPMFVDTFKLLGVIPTPMSFPEVFTGLQQGTVDGQENPLAVIFSAKFYEVQKYLSLTGHCWTSVSLIINKSIWDKLPKDIQTVMQKNAIRCRDYQRDLIQKSDFSLIAELKKKMQVNEVDTRPFRAATRPIYDKYAPVFGKDLMDLVDKYSK